VALTGRCEASLHVLHVLETIVGPNPLEVQFGARGALERAVAESAWDDLRQQFSDHDQARLRVRLDLQWGTPVAEILRYARAYHIDLITMGRHGRGRGGLKPLLMGSVAEGVVRSAPCAVLSVRLPGPVAMAGEHHVRAVPHIFGH
jgi:nucleotide-binding universal stress UspA family protein